MPPINLGIIGHGVIGKMHFTAATSIPEKINVVAVADLREEARQEAAKAGAAKIYRNDDELLADPRVEAVITAMPTGVRNPVVLKALKAGKHVLFEKPPAMNASVIREYIALRKNLTVGCCSSRMTFSPSVEVMTKFIASGALGPLRIIRIRATLGAGKPPKNAPPPWRESFPLNGGGILVNWGIYDLNYMLELTGWKLQPQSVFAQFWPIAPIVADRAAPHSDADSHYIALIRCAGGEVISWERGEFMALKSEEQWQIVGTNASLTMVMHPRNEKTIQLDEATPDGVVSRTLWQGDDSIAPAKLQEDFADAIREKRPPKASLEHALLMQQIFDSIYASARTGAAAEIAHVS